MEVRTRLAHCHPSDISTSPHATKQYSPLQSNVPPQPSSPSDPQDGNIIKETAAPDFLLRTSRSSGTLDSKSSSHTQFSTDSGTQNLQLHRDDSQHIPSHDYAFFEWDYEESDLDGREIPWNSRKLRSSVSRFRKNPKLNHHKRWATGKYRSSSEPRHHGFRFPMHSVGFETSVFQPPPLLLRQQQLQRHQTSRKRPTIEELMISSIHRSESTRGTIPCTSNRHLGNPASYNIASTFDSSTAYSGALGDSPRAYVLSPASTMPPILGSPHRKASRSLTTSGHFKRCDSSSPDRGQERMGTPGLFSRQWSGPDAASVPLRRLWTRLTNKLRKTASTSSAPSSTRSPRSIPRS